MTQYYIENTKESVKNKKQKTKNLLKLINASSKLSGYKANIQIQFYFYKLAKNNCRMK